MNHTFKKITISTLAIVFSLALSVDIARAARRDRSSSSFEPKISKLAQSLSLQGCWRLAYNAFGVSRDSTLNLNVYSSTIDTRFYNRSTNQYESVQQIVQVSNLPQGLVISGSSPVYQGTNTLHLTYVPTNFLLQRYPNGTYGIFYQDNLGWTLVPRVSACAVG